ncbi:MAG: hypothetical protein Q4F65_13015 [Propionibacteriaceae bacterium]|nr:hypothetical protein [Propionibacteriaceae bacterium]
MEISEPDPGAAESDADDPTEAETDVWRASHPNWQPKGEWAYAEKLKGRVFMITTDLIHPDDGRELMTAERVEEVISRKGNLRTAWVIHDRDPYVAEDVATNPRAVLGAMKPTHVHAVEERRNATTAGQVARAYRVAPNFVKLGKGHGAFLDFVEYLTHESEKEQAKGKALYSDDEIHANFDFRLEVDEHVAARKAGLSGRGSKFQRLVEQCLLDVLEGRKTPEDIRDDPDLKLVYAKHHLKLRDLHHDFLSRDENRPKVGEVYRKATVAILGPTRSGKGLLADAVRDETMALATAAGQKWTYAQPAGRNALEGVGTAEVVHHDDARHWLLPTYDEWLRYLDPNRATEVATRFRNRPPVAPRVIMASSSQTLMSLGLSALLQKMPSELAETASKRRPVNIDEFLLRIGWLVNVQKPSGETDPEVIRDEMLVGISKVVEGEASRIEEVIDRDGQHLGNVSTRHQVELVAVVKGASRAARFLAVSMIAECSPDVAAVIPGEVMDGYAAHSQAVIEAEQQRRDEELRRENERIAQEQSRKLKALEKQVAELPQKQVAAEERRRRNEAEERERRYMFAERNLVKQGFILDPRASR